VPEDAAVNAVPIPQQESQCRIIREGLRNLPGCPLGGWAWRDIEVNDLASMVAKHDEAVKNTEDNCRDGEQVDGGRLGHVVYQEAAPGLGRWLGMPEHVLGHGGFSYVVSQQKQLGKDPRCTPCRVLPGHAADESPDLPPNR